MEEFKHIAVYSIHPPFVVAVAGAKEVDVEKEESRVPVR